MKTYTTPDPIGPGRRSTIIAMVVLTLALAIGLPLLVACPPTSSSGGSSPPDPGDISAEAELAVELAFQVSLTTSTLAKQAAVDDSNGNACLAAASAEGAIGVAHSAWRGALALERADDELLLPPVTVDASACLPLGLPAPEVDLDVDRQVRIIVGSLSGGLVAVADFVCEQEGRDDRCLQLQASAGALSVGHAIYADLVDQFIVEVDQPDGIVQVPIPPIPIPRRTPELTPAEAG